MGLSADLISQFVKVTKNETKTKNETTVYGTVVKNGDSVHVHIDGSPEGVLTPISNTTSVNNNDRVSVLIKNHTAIVTGNLTHPSVSDGDVLARVNERITEFDTILANKIGTAELNAEVGRIETLISERVTANEALFAELQAVDANITGRLEATEASIDSLNATYAGIDDLFADVANIETLIFGSATGNVIHSSFSNAVIAQLGNAQIKSAMIDSVSAAKITAGDIITNNVHVKSSDGRLLISDETIKISDANRVRVQIGKDSENDYSITILDKDGNVMFSKGGITDKAITSAIIRNDMVSETANIAASKLDIDSLFEEINGSSKTIKSSQIYFDSRKQTLDVAFTSLTTYAGALANNITSQGTQISAIEGQISSKIWEQDCVTNGTFNSTMTTCNNQINILSTRYSSLEQNLSGFKTTVSSTYATKSELSSVEQTSSELAVRLESDILAASKTASNFLNYSSSGLVIGNHTASTLGKNVLIASESVKIRTGTTVNAVFGADIIELAKDNDSATISMLKGAFKIYYDADSSDGGFGVYGKTPDGTERLAFQPVNENGNLTLGWGGYAQKANSTNLYGHKMYLTTNEDIILNPGSGYIHMDGNVILTNGKNLFWKNTNGDMRSMAILNANNQMVFGYGSYSNSEGSVYYEGNVVSVMAKSDINLVPTGLINAGGNMVFDNNAGIYAKNTSGTRRSMLTLNSDNQMLFGYGSYNHNEGTVYYDGNNVQIRSKNDITFKTANETVVLQDGDGSATYSAFFRPGTNAKCTLGTNANRWYAVYASNGTIQTSDAREKENIVALGDIHSALFDAFKPVEYNFIEGNGRICYGLLSQDVVASMRELGIGEHELDLVHHDTYVDDEGNNRDTYGISYNNIIAMLIYEVQKLKSEIKNIKK